MKSIYADLYILKSINSNSVITTNKLLYVDQKIFLIVPKLDSVQS